MASNSGPHVFVVDDEPVIASTLAAILERSGYSATFFTSPLEALAAAQANAPDLMISDVVMPGLSGIDLAMRVRLNAPECKILLFSAQTCRENLLDNARSQGHNFELLEKPVHPTAILSRVAALIAESGLAPKACNAYQLLKQDCESALREEALYKFGSVASLHESLRYQRETKAAIVAAKDRLISHSNSCLVCVADRG